MAALLPDDIPWLQTIVLYDNHTRHNSLLHLVGTLLADHAMSVRNYQNTLTLFLESFNKFKIQVKPYVVVVTHGYTP